MCLLVKDFKIKSGEKSSFSLEDVVKISEEDIYVYKLFNKLSDIKRNDINRFKTPYQGYKISDQGDIMVEDAFSYRFSKFNFPNDDQNDDDNLVEIHNGIHCYSHSGVCYRNTSVMSIVPYRERFGPIQDLFSVFLKCMIPAGTPYIEGRNGDIVSLILVIPPVDEQSVFVVPY